MHIRLIHLAWLICLGCSRQMAGAHTSAVSGEIRTTVRTYTQPVLRGVAHNPVLQVAVSVPARSSFQLQQLALELNAEAVQSIDSIEVYLTGAESFHARQRLGVGRAVSGQMTLQVPVTLTGGQHFIWISPVLRATASIHGMLDIQCTGLTGDKGTRLAVANQAGRPLLRKGVAVRKAGDDNVHTYRIPGIAQTDKGTLIAVYDIRYLNDRDLPGHIDVGMSRSTDGGQTWEPMRVIMDMGAPHENNGIGDPAVLFDPQTRTIWVAALWSKGNRSIAGSMPGLSPDTTGQFVLVKSSDDGLTWSEPINITRQVKRPEWHLFFNGPGVGIAMQNGNLVFAAQYWDEKRMPHATLIYSNDHGASWKGRLAGPKANTTEAQVVETTAGTLMLNMRDNRGRYRSVATTTDLGESWTEHATSYLSLPDPVCMAGLLKTRVSLPGGNREVIFFSNPATPSGRYNLTIKASTDLGHSWRQEHQLLIDERNSYGYSSISRIDDKTIGLLYEGIRDLYFVAIPVDQIIRQ